MIFEYALEPEMVAAWCRDHYKCRFFQDHFGVAQGRLVSRYPKKWAKKVWKVSSASDDMDKTRLTELLARLKDTMVKRKDMVWNDEESWLQNALQEHGRFPFRAILASGNPEGRSEVLDEGEITAASCPAWDNPHGKIVHRQAAEMANATKEILTCCRWVKFIDPYFSQCKQRHKDTLREFFRILFRERPVGPPDTIEIHASGSGTGATIDHLKEFYEKIIPISIQVTLFQWQKKPGGQSLHNRYILTDIGGVSFAHGLDTGAAGETDDIHRLDSEQYQFRCRQYDPKIPAFDQTEEPIKIIGTLER